MLGVAIPVRRAIGVNEWMLEEPQLELRPEDSGEGAVDHRVADDQLAKRIEIRSMLVVGRLEDHVEARVEGVHRRRCGTLLGVVEHGGPAGRGRVGDHESLKAPVVPQAVGEQRMTL